MRFSAESLAAHIPQSERLTARVIALDLGTRTGGVIFGGVHKPLQPIMWDFKSDAAKAHSFFQRLCKLLSEYEPDILLYEKVVQHNKGNSAFTQHAYGGYFASLQGACSEYKVPHTGFVPAQVKKAVTGNGRAEKSELRSALDNTYGLKLPETYTDDVSDAIGVLITWLKLTDIISLEKKANRRK